MNFKEFLDMSSNTKMVDEGMFILEIYDDNINESEIFEGIEEELNEKALPDTAISKTLKKDVVSMSKTNLDKITDTFIKLVKKEYSAKGKAKPRILGRVRYINDSGKVSEYPIYSFSKTAEDKIKDNAAKGTSKKSGLSAKQLKVLVNKDNAWRVINTAKILGLIFKGKLFTLKTNENGEMSNDKQSTGLHDYVTKAADAKYDTIDKIRNYLINIGITNEKDLPTLYNKDVIKQNMLKNINDNKTSIDNYSSSATTDLYVIAISGYNFKNKKVDISIKLNLEKIISYKYGLNSLAGKNVPVGSTASQWKASVKTMKEDIINEIKAYNFSDVKIGTKYINIGLQI